MRETKLRLFTRALAVSAVVLGAFALTPASPASAPVAPGTFISTPVGGCTLGFVFDEPGTVYMATAAHCVNKVGDAVKLQGGSVVGHAAVIGSAGRASTDWALIKIDPDYVSRVRAGVIGHAHAPSGFSKRARTGEEVSFSGYGIPWNATSTTRTHRFGFMSRETHSSYELIGSDTWGDSGGPIILAHSGQAMGLVSRFCYGLCTSEGPTVQGILEQAAAKGLDLKLRTVTP